MMVKVTFFYPNLKEPFRFHRPYLKMQQVSSIEFAKKKKI